MWQFAPNSIHYLLSLWQRMVASIPYVRAVEPHHLDTYTPEVTKAYITSRLDSARVIIRDGLEDPLDDLAMVQQQLDQLSVIVRCEYEKTCSFVINTFDQVCEICFSSSSVEKNVKKNIDFSFRLLVNTKNCYRIQLTMPLK